MRRVDGGRDLDGQDGAIRPAGREIVGCDDACAEAGSLSFASTKETGGHAPEEAVPA